MHYSHDENGEFKVSGSQGTLRTERRLGVGRGGEGWGSCSKMSDLYYFIIFTSQSLPVIFIFLLRGWGRCCLLSTENAN